MEADDFVAFANKMAEYITEYVAKAKDKRVTPDVQPGYLRSLIPDSAPEKPDKWEDVMADIDTVIMPGTTHWVSPHFHALFPIGQSYPSIVADMLGNAIGCAGITWIASPVCTELEMVTVDWLGKMLDLPSDFLFSSGGKGGGVIQGSGSDSNFMAMLAAKAKMIKKIKDENPSLQDDDITSKLMGYSSDQTHSSVLKAGLLGNVKFRLIETDENRKMKSKLLLEAIHQDREAGLYPFFVTATLGTTASCAFDNIDEIGDVTSHEGLWLHVDAAYAGPAFICPENRYLLKGIEKAESFMLNPHKWLLVNIDCSTIWFKDNSWISDSLNMQPSYLKTDNQSNIPEYRHWHVALSRRFRSLKLWFVFRLYGCENLRAYIRKHITLARHFEDICKLDDRFEIVEKVLTGLVCFRLKHSNEANEELIKLINSRGIIFMTPAKVQNKYCLRFVVCSRFTERNDVDFSWKEISQCAAEILMKM